MLCCTVLGIFLKLACCKLLIWSIVSLAICLWAAWRGNEFAIPRMISDIFLEKNKRGEEREGTTHGVEKLGSLRYTKANTKKALFATHSPITYYIEAKMKFQQEFAQKNNEGTLIERRCTTERRCDKEPYAHIVLHSGTWQKKGAFSSLSLSLSSLGKQCYNMQTCRCRRIIGWREREALHYYYGAPIMYQCDHNTFTYK